MNLRIPMDIRPLMRQYVEILASRNVHPVGIYLVGSIALGSFSPSRSDVDFLTIVEEGDWSEVFLGKLAEVHRQVEKVDVYGGKMDGVYMRLGDVGKSNASMRPYPFVHDGTLYTGYWDVNAVTWWVFERHGFAVMGDEAERHNVRVSWNDLHSTMRYNIHEYWKRQIQQTELFLNDEWVIDGVLTLCRILYTLQHRDVVSKVAAGTYGLTTLPVKWHRVIREAIRLREGVDTAEFYKDEERAAETVEFIRFGIARFRELDNIETLGGLDSL